MENPGVSARIKTSLDVQRPLAIGAMLLTALLVVVGGLDFFVWH